MLLSVLDTNALTHACWLVKNGHQHDKVTALAGTGRATPYIAAHVPGEIDKHLPRLADDYQVAERVVRRLLTTRILPALRLVDLEIRDHLSPRSRRILHVDPDMPKKYQGDPDDAPTMALAEFLGPCVIVTEDSVFYRTGVAVIEWIPVHQNLLRLANLEVTAANAMVFIEGAVRAVRRRRSPHGRPRRTQPAARHGPRGRAAGVWLPKRLPDPRQLETEPIAAGGGDGAAAGNDQRRDDRAPDAQRLAPGSGAAEAGSSEATAPCRARPASPPGRAGAVRPSDTSPTAVSPSCSSSASRNNASRRTSGHTTLITTAFD